MGGQGWDQNPPDNWFWDWEIQTAQQRKAFAVRKVKAVTFNLPILESLSQAGRHNLVPID